MPVNERVLLQKMIVYCENAMKYSQGVSYDDFIENELYLTFSVFALSQLGELSVRAGTSFHEKYPELPWQALRGIRNRIVHDYDGLRFAILWDVITKEIPALRSTLQRLLKQYADE